MDYVMGYVYDQDLLKYIYVGAAVIFFNWEIASWHTNSRTPME